MFISFFRLVSRSSRYKQRFMWLMRSMAKYPKNLSQFMKEYAKQQMNAPVEVEVNVYGVPVLQQPRFGWYGRVIAFNEIE